MPIATGTRPRATATAEAYALHQQRVEGPEAYAIDRRVVARIKLGAAMPMVAYVALTQARARLVAQSAAEMAGHCIVAMPTVPHTAPPIAPLEADDDLFVKVNLKTLRNTMLGNFLGWCGVSFPTGTDALGLPTALLLSGAPGTDEHLLALALSVEALMQPGANR